MKAQRTVGRPRRARHKIIAVRLVMVASAAVVPLTVGLSTEPAAAGVRQQVNAHPSTSHHRGGQYRTRRRGTDLRPHNVRPRPDFHAFCGSHSPNNPHCISLELAAIRHARKVEGFTVHAMVLPRDYTSLSYAEQTFVVTDLERVERGLRPFSAMVPQLNQQAAAGARSFSDPSITGLLANLLGLREWGTIWAEDLGPLAADYDWMYDDGYGSFGPRILGCNHVRDQGCWAHRDKIIARFGHRQTLVAGAATYRRALSIAEILSAGSDRPTVASYRWRSAVRAGAA